MPLSVARALYLVKANDDYVSWCKCRNAPIGLPRQLSCPWCGCGWLFTCINCGKAFTFAKAVLMAQPLEKIAQAQVPVIQRVMDGKTGEIAERPIAETASKWCELMRPLLAGIRSGKTYVYFDGAVIPADAGRIQIIGQHRHHDIPFVPQVRAMTHPAEADAILGNIEYWNEGRA